MERGHTQVAEPAANCYLEYAPREEHQTDKVACNAVAAHGGEHEADDSVTGCGMVRVEAHCLEAEVIPVARNALDSHLEGSPLGLADTRMRDTLVVGSYVDALPLVENMLVATSSTAELQPLVILSQEAHWLDH